MRPKVLSRATAPRSVSSSDRGVAPPSEAFGCLSQSSASGAHPGYSSPQPLAALMVMLQRSTRASVHETWFDDISILDTARFQHSHMHGHRQLTDLYLLGLAVKNNGRLASFDQRIPISAVLGARPEQIVTL